MNRKQRRAAQKTVAAGGFQSSGPVRSPEEELFIRAGEHHKRGELGEAETLYRKVLALRPSHAPTFDRLGLIYLAQGQRAQASAQYAALARAAPQTLQQFSKVVDILKQLQPPLALALSAGQAAISFASPDLAPIAADPYFRIVLEWTIVRDLALERWLTALRSAILRAALAGDSAASDDMLALYGALAQQCFNNEYVFAVTPDEAENVERLKSHVADGLARGTAIDPIQPLALGMYLALNSLPNAQALTQRAWPAPADAVVTQQVREPLEELDLRASMPRLTPIGGGVTAQVRQQYEENPYPRWVRLASPSDPLMVLDEHLRRQFPSISYRPVGKRDSLDVLVAGCGTGRNALEFAQSFRGANVLGVDISLASLANAKRHRPPALAAAIDFAQGDILNIGSIGRTFDLIIAGGVLHHMEHPLAGWRELLKLMAPDGLMQVGLYSAYARRDIIAARAMIAERGYRPTPEDIRRCRQDLLNGNETFSFMKLNDFFTVSECRDLLFHVHERQLTIPEIKNFLVENDLKFIGFEFFPQPAHVHYHSLFAKAGWPDNDLDRWDAYERANPDTFAGMYIFWIQKS